MEETLFFGDAVKALGDGKVGGYLVRFTTAKDPDVTQSRDYFTADTDFFLESAEVKRFVVYDHGLDVVLKRRKIGAGVMKVDDVGVWIEAQLEMRDDYERAIYDMAQAGKLGWSSGSASHLVEKKRVGNANEIKSWPIVEASLTPTPAEPRNGAVSLKRYTEERAGKNVFEDAVAERSQELAARASQICELTETLQSLLWQLQWMSMSARETGIEFDAAARIEEILAGFVPAARRAALVMVGIGDDVSAKTTGDVSPISDPYGRLTVSLPLTTHSKAVRDAARSLLGRMQELHAQRKQREGKSRTLNASHTENLEQLASDLEGAAKAARDLTSDVSAHESVRRARVEFQRTVARGMGVR